MLCLGDERIVLNVHGKPQLAEYGAVDGGEVRGLRVEEARQWRAFIFMHFYMHPHGLNFLRSVI
jgi:hypothetical protein